LSNFFEEMKWRGLVQDATRDAEKYLAEEKHPVGYAGFDPTAPSLHIGHLLGVMALAHLQRQGGKPIAVVGGGTGMIGDPSGKSAERTFKTVAELEHNQTCLAAQLSRFIDFSGKHGTEMVNNYDWLGEVSLMAFLRDVGKYYTVNQMLAKDSVKIRLERSKEGAEGISFTEFTYMLMQAYDFLQLFDRRGCRFQMGGSDQWGNITAGIELIGRLRNLQAYGLVWPLIMSSSGQKFGKSEAGTVWLDAEMTSPYRFYQYWINIEDTDVDRYLKFFTLKEHEEIEATVAAHMKEPHKRTGQTALAEDVTLRVHGKDGLARAQAATKALFGGDLNDLSATDLADVFADVPSVDIANVPDASNSFTVVDLAVWSGMAKSKGEARRLIEGGGVYINNCRVEDMARPVEKTQRIHGKFLVLRKGNKSYWLVTWAQ
jgi:tyrosyl-tRNA synthetase